MQNNPSRFPSLKLFHCQQKHSSILKRVKSLKVMRKICSEIKREAQFITIIFNKVAQQNEHIPGSTQLQNRLVARCSSIHGMFEFETQLVPHMPPNTSEQARQSSWGGFCKPNVQLFWLRELESKS